MWDELIRNFNWSTFFISLALFVLVTNIFNLIKVYIIKARADKQLKLAQTKLNDLKKQMQTKNLELDNLLKQKEKK